MNNGYESFLFILNNLVADIAVYLPRVGAAIAVFLIGWVFARAIRGTTLRLLSAVLKSGAIKKTPADHFLANAEVGQRLEELVARVVYWLLMLIVLYTTASVLGLRSLTMLLEQIINYIPSVIAALIVFIFGVFIAGVVESLVKSAVRTIDTKSSFIAGKLSGYFVLSIAGLAAISELGIAREFILILFVGFVMMMSLGAGLAIGLGSKDLISELLHDWYKQKVEK